MKYLTTLEVARELNVSKQTLLNWLYAKKVPEPVVILGAALAGILLKMLAAT